MCPQNTAPILHSNFSFSLKGTLISGNCFGASAIGTIPAFPMITSKWLSDSNC